MTAQAQWLTPSPLWNELAALTDKTAFRRPILLRFATDEFMDELSDVLQRRAASLRDYVARPETWRAPATGLGPFGTASTSLPTNPQPLKLYQPVHQRFYLVAAALSCRLPGLPDHRVQPALGEKTSFVLRRVRAKAQNGDVFDPRQRDEAAWVGTSERGVWAPASAAAPAAGEERLALFPVFFDADAARRRVLAGLIPASRRQAYATGRDAPPDAGAAAGTAPSSAPSGAAASPDPRMFDFQRAVMDPWAALVEWWDEQPAVTARVADAAEQATPYMLLDFAEFLDTHLHEVWEAIGRRSPAGLSGAPLALYTALDGATLGDRTGAGTSRITLTEALRHAAAHRDALENVALTTTDASVLQARGRPALPAGYSPVLLTDTGPAPSPGPLRRLIARPSGSTRANPLPRPIEGLIRDALPPQAAPGTPAPGTVATEPARTPSLPPADARDDDWYVVRCVYERPQCGAATALTSPPSEPFQLASFFDPDAPARSLQVALPIDTSPAALRKYDRNVTMVLSNELRAQLKRVTSMKDLVDGSIGGPQLDISVVCSLSLPIITLCALILLIVMVSVLNIVFFWLPSFILCLPIPGLKAKRT
jgi:hypothetical protein